VSGIHRLIRFGPFEFDTQVGLLRKHGIRIKLHRQPAQVLSRLVSQPGEIVTREQFRTLLWRDDTFVDFDHGLNNAINRLRDVLGDAATDPRYIETVPKSGYRFVAATKELLPQVPQADSLTDLAKTASAAESPVASGETHRSGQIAGWWRVAAVILMGLTLGMSGGIPRSPQRPIRSLVVLPFENLSADSSQDYFSDGMTDALITELARVSSLRVISRTSAMQYKKSQKTLPEIARDLNVDAVVEGSVSRTDERIRITAQLIQADTDRHLWAQSYNRGLRDVLSLQQDVARSIVGAVQARIDPRADPTVAETGAVNPVAYEAYLKGLYFSRETFPGDEKAIHFFEEAAALDPKYGAAHAALAELYAWDGGRLEKARDEAELALGLDERLSTAHAALAWVKYIVDWEFTGAETEYRRALDLSSGNVEAHQAYGYFLACRGRMPEAFAQMEAARQLDPISPKMNMLYGLVLFQDRRYREAQEKFDRVLELDPHSLNTRRHMLRNFEQMGDFPRAIGLYSRVASWFGESDAAANLHALQLRRAYEQSGPTGYWQQRLFIEKHQDRDAISPLRIAEVEAHLGNVGPAIAILEQLYESKDGSLVRLLNGPQFDALRGNTRYQDLLVRMGFPPS
jgi:TolB-like protein/DNA-binding winged helix-turn-helix (wHTH) protein/Tfp pilus assembly protein PilF